MAIFRVEKTKDYTIMSNYHLKEKGMSLKAKGLLSLMLSLPDNWDYSIAGLVAISKENETSIKTALDELKEFGYLKVIKKMPNETGSGRIEYEYIVFEKKQESEKQGIENLGVENQGVENQVQLNTNELNTNKLNTIYIMVLDYLNEKAGTHFKPVDCHIKLIKARLKSYSLEQVKGVIDMKVKEWKGTLMQQYLRPKTLFCETNFENYANCLPAHISTTKITEKTYSQQELNSLFNFAEVEI